MSAHPALGPLMWARVTAAAGWACPSSPGPCRPPGAGVGGQLLGPTRACRGHLHSEWAGQALCPAVSGPVRCGCVPMASACVSTAFPAGVWELARVGWGASGAPLIALPSAEDASPARESLGHEGSSGGQEDPASKQWGERGARVTVILGHGGGLARGPR